MSRPADAEGERARGTARFAFLTLVTLGLLAVVFTFVPFDETVEAARRLPRGAIAVVLAISTFFNVFFYAHRWRVGLAYVGIRVSFWEVVRVHLGTGPLRLVLPMQTGEILTSAALARRANQPAEKVVGTMAYNKYLTLMATLALLGVGVAAGADSPVRPARALGGLGLAVVAALVTLESRAVRTVLMRVAEKLHLRLGRGVTLLLAAFEEIPRRGKLRLFCYSALFQFSEVIACWFLTRALGIELSFAALTAMVQLLILGSMLPISLAGVGPREGLALILLARSARPQDAVAFGLAYSMAEYLWPLVVGLPLTASLGLDTLRREKRP
ncbi:MAG: flippase-like domain-containing protein [Deltaproteobacteria bacterium]|nr:flippase-like domain-containing protein [Deltaproteobacteria bacterium]